MTRCHVYLGRHLLKKSERHRERARRPVWATKILKNSMVDEADGMWETCALDLRVNLPKGVAAEVEEVQRRDPEMLSRMVMYAVTRRTIFDHLATRTAWPRGDRET